MEKGKGGRGKKRGKWTKGGEKSEGKNEHEHYSPKNEKKQRRVITLEEEQPQDAVPSGVAVEWTDKNKGCRP